MIRQKFFLVFLGFVSVVIIACESQEKKIQTLTMRLGDANAEVRLAATEALVKIGNPAAIPALMKAFSDKEQRVHRTAAEALVKIGEPAVPELVQALNHEEQRVRLAAVETLVKIREPAVPALIQALEYEQEKVRYHAASALGRIGEPAKDVVPALIKALNDIDKDVQLAAGMALSQIGEPAVPALIQTLSHEQEKVRYHAASVLGRIGQPANDAVPALTQALDDKEQDVRSAVATALEKIGTAEAVSALEKWKSTLLASMIPDNKKIQELIKKYMERRDSHYDLRSVTIIAIGKPSEDVYGNKYWPVKAKIKGDYVLRLGPLGWPGGGKYIPARTERHDVNDTCEYTLYKNDSGEWEVTIGFYH